VKDKKRHKKTSVLDPILDKYGDMLYDLCHAIMGSQLTATQAFRAILKDIKKRKKNENYEQFERNWVFRVAYLRLLKAAKEHTRLLSPAEQIMLDATLNVQDRLMSFESYFSRLDVVDRFLLLLHTKYAFSYEEIASILNEPEGTLKIKKQQALRNLEERVWNKR